MAQAVNPSEISADLQAGERIRSALSSVAESILEHRRAGEVDPGIKLTRDIPQFRGLWPRTRRRLAAEFKEHVIPRDRIIVSEGDELTTVWVITKGRAAILAGGEVSRVVRPGDQFADGWIADGRVLPVTVRTLSRVRALAIDSKRLVSLLTEDLSPSRKLIFDLSTQILAGNNQNQA